MSDVPKPHIKLDGDDPRIERIFATHRFVPLNLYDEITKLAEYAIGEIIEEQNNLVEQLEAERRANVGLSADLTRFGKALMEILERPHGELDEHEMRSIAHAALNPARSHDA